jgi:hypothetical protein
MMMMMMMMMMKAPERRCGVAQRLQGEIVEPSGIVRLGKGPRQILFPLVPLDLRLPVAAIASGGAHAAGLFLHTEQTHHILPPFPGGVVILGQAPVIEALDQGDSRLAADAAVEDQPSEAVEQTPANIAVNRRVLDHGGQSRDVAVENGKNDVGQIGQPTVLANCLGEPSVRASQQAHERREQVGARNGGEREQAVAEKSLLAWHQEDAASPQARR